MSLLEISHLTTSFSHAPGDGPGGPGCFLPAGAGEVLGIVGESGSGKRRRHADADGAAGLQWNRGERNDPLQRGGYLPAPRPRQKGPPGNMKKMMRQIRGNRIGMIFQDPMTFLNPILKTRNPADGGNPLPSALLPGRGQGKGYTADAGGGNPESGKRRLDQ